MLKLNPTDYIILRDACIAALREFRVCAEQCQQSGRQQLAQVWTNQASLTYDLLTRIEKELHHAK